MAGGAQYSTVRGDRTDFSFWRPRGDRVDIIDWENAT